jgi:DNA transposition AAA+ family ATPase
MNTALAERTPLNLTVVNPPQEPAAGAPASVHATRWSVRMADVYAATKELPEDHRGEIRWLDHHARSKNMTLREIAALLKDARGEAYSDNTVYKAMTGRHEAKLDNFVRAIARYRLPFAARPSEEKIPYVPISQSTSIISYVEKCEKYQRMGLVFGRNQIGKTTAFKQLRISRPFGQVQIFLVPANGYLSQLVSSMCMEKKIATGDSTGEQKERLMRTFDASMILVFDEMDQCYMGAPGKKPRTDTFEFVRQIHERTGATVIECATPAVHNEMITGVDRVLFERTIHRSLPPYIIGETIPESDLNAFAEILGLDPADGTALTLQTKVIDKEGLGYWLMYLQCARGIAAKKSRPVIWGDVIHADDEFLKMVSGGKKKGGGK